MIMRETVELVHEDYSGGVNMAGLWRMELIWSMGMGPGLIGPGAAWPWFSWLGIPQPDDTMRCLLMLHRSVFIMQRSGFIIFLFIGAFQDIKRHRINVGLFIISGSAGMALRFLQMIAEMGLVNENIAHSLNLNVMWWHMGDTVMAMAVGCMLLLLSVFTGEAIGKGDGWFFVVSGIYLGMIKNLVLLAGGLGLCFLVCMVLMVRGIITGKDLSGVRLPFLPFLIPAGIGVMFI